MIALLSSFLPSRYDSLSSICTASPHGGQRAQPCLLNASCCVCLLLPSRNAGAAAGLSAAAIAGIAVASVVGVVLLAALGWYGYQKRLEHLQVTEFQRFREY